MQWKIYIKTMMSIKFISTSQKVCTVHRVSSDASWDVTQANTGSVYQFNFNKNSLSDVLVCCLVGNEVWKSF